jgi:hypothetical protein
MRNRLIGGLPPVVKDRANLVTDDSFRMPGDRPTVEEVLPCVSGD